MAEGKTDRTEDLRRFERSRRVFPACSPSASFDVLRLLLDSGGMDRMGVPTA